MHSAETSPASSDHLVVVELCMLKAKGEEAVCKEGHFLLLLEDIGLIIDKHSASVNSLHFFFANSIA